GVLTGANVSTDIAGVPSGERAPGVPPGERSSGARGIGAPWGARDGEATQRLAMWSPTLTGPTGSAPGRASTAPAAEVGQGPDERSAHLDEGELPMGGGGLLLVLRRGGGEEVGHPPG